MPEAQKKRPFTIAFVLEDLHCGGATFVTQRYALSLAGMGYATTLIVTGGRGTGDTAGESDGVPVMSLPPCTLEKLAGILEGFDAVVIANAGGSPFAFEAARFTHRPLIVELLHSSLRAGAFPAADMTIAVSEHLFNTMQPRPQDTCIPNGVDLSLFSPGERAWKEKVVLIQIALQGKEMKPDLADIARDLISEGLPVEALIVGREGASSGGITYCGRRRHEEIPLLLRQADILLHMSVSETFGMTAIEAMATGVIPVVADIGGLSQNVISGETGYVIPPEDRVKTKAVLEEVVGKFSCGHPDIQALRERGLARVRERYSLSAASERLGALLVQKAGTMQRCNRLSCRPFSFIAPSLYFNLAESDYYLAAIEDAENAGPLAERLAEWKKFLEELSIAGQEVGKNIRMFNFLDRVYSVMVAETGEGRDAHKAFNFWLALLTLPLQRYDRTIEYLGRGLNNRADARPLMKRLAFALVCLWAYFFDAPVTGDMTKAAEHIKNCYVSGDFDSICQLDMTDGFLDRFFTDSGVPLLLRAIDGEADRPARGLP